MPIHSNGYVRTAVHGNSYSNYKANWREAAGWPDWYAHSGYSVKYGQYTYSQAYNNKYYNNPTDHYKDEPYSTFDLSPKLTGSVTPFEGTIASASVDIDLTSIIYTDTEGSAREASRIYYRYSKTGSSFDPLVLLTETTASHYIWNLAGLEPGYYRLFVTMSDGNTWSALPDPTNTRFIAENIETGSTGTVVVDHSKDTISYCTSGILRIIEYSPPEWLSKTIDKVQIDQLQDEIGKARKGFGLTAFTFSDTNVVKDFDRVSVTDINELKEASNDVYKQVKGIDYDFNRDLDSGDINKTKPKNKDVKDIQDLLDSLV